jgi:hypothetical protein
VYAVTDQRLIVLAQETAVLPSGESKGGDYAPSARGDKLVTEEWIASKTPQADQVASASDGCRTGLRARPTGMNGTTGRTRTAFPAYLILSRTRGDGVRSHRGDRDCAFAWLSLVVAFAAVTWRSFALHPERDHALLIGVPLGLMAVGGG